MTTSSTLRSAHPPRLRSTFTLSGCRHFAMTDTDLIDYEGRYEYWEAGIAWELPDPSPRHEWPRGRLAALIFDIARISTTF